MKSVAQAELSLVGGVPILQPFFEKVLECLDHLRFAALDLRDSVVFRALLETRGRVLEGDWSIPITDAARVSFEQCFGTTPEEQRLLEAKIEKLSAVDFDLTGFSSAYLSGLTSFCDPDAPVEERD